MKIRNATRDDLGALVALVDESNALHARLVPDVFQEAPGTARSFLASLLDQPQRVVLAAEREDGLVGLVHAEMLAPAGLQILVPCVRAHVHELVVAERARRSGVGRALMHAAEQWARSRGATVVELNVFAVNEGAAAFYAALGYAPAFVRLRRSL